MADNNINMQQIQNDLDYAFGKIEGMDDVRDMFYFGGVMQRMLDTLTPEEFKQVFEDKRHEFNEYHKNRQNEARDLVHGSFEQVFEKTLGDYPKDVEDWFNNNLDNDYIEFYVEAGFCDKTVCISAPATIDDFINEICDYAENFDVNAEVEMYVESKPDGMPDVETVLNDQRDFKNNLEALAENLCTWRNCSEQYKQIKHIEKKDYSKSSRDAAIENKEVAQNKPAKQVELKK